MSLEDLYKFGKLKKHNTSPEEIKDLFDVSQRCLEDASQKNISLDLRFIAAYQGALAAAGAILYCFGYEAPKDSFYYMTWQALKNIPDTAIKKVIILFDKARQKRGSAFYDRADVVSETEFKEFFKETKAFVDYIKEKIGFPALYKE